MIQFNFQAKVISVMQKLMCPKRQLRTYVKESVSSVYNIEYLTQLVRTIGKSCNNIGIEYGSQTPIKLLFEMPSRIEN